MFYTNRIKSAFKFKNVDVVKQQNKKQQTMTNSSNNAIRNNTRSSTPSIHSNFRTLLNPIYPAIFVFSHRLSNPSYYFNAYLVVYSNDLNQRFQ